MDDRYDEEWVAFRCSDCDPTLADADEPDDPAHNFEKPYVLAVPKGESTPDLCPRCGSYLSLLDTDAELQVTTKWMRRRAVPRRDAEWLVRRMAEAAGG